MSSISILNPDQQHRWDSFVAKHPHGTLFHLSKWRSILESVFKSQTCYLMYHEGDILRGILPLGRVKSMLFGDALISVPFGVYGGILAETESARLALMGKAKDIATELRVDYLELRETTPNCTEGVGQSLYVAFKKELSADPDENLKAIPRKQRAVVRKGIDLGLQSEIISEIDPFFLLYSESVRNLGTPVLPKSHFQCLKETFGDACEILLIKKDNVPLSAVMSFYYKDTVLPYYGGGNDRARSCYANDFMYWALMNRALERDCRWFDYGRSKKDSGSYRFKKHWGFPEAPLNYRYCLIEAKQPPNLNPYNPKYQMMIKAWQKLPLGVSRLLGPMIASKLG
ncbi:MAG: FemAB family XrtA/PEP-CTERM system-associated protein [Gammaproteobacteria bacterium]